MILTSQWNDLVKNAKVQWREGYKLVPMAARTLYDVAPVEVQTSEHSQIDGPGFAKRKQEGQKYAVGSPKQGYSLNLSQTRIGLMEAVTWEMRKFDKYREINKKMRGLGESTAQRMELDATHQFTFGFDGSYTNMDGETVNCLTADGQYNFDTDHTITGGSDTFSNKITSQFDVDALEEIENLFVQFQNNNKMKVVVTPDTIWCTDNPTLNNAIDRVLGSDKDPENATQAINPYAKKYKKLVLPYLATDANGAYDSTKKNYWGIASKAHTDAIMEVSEYPTFKAAKPDSNGEDFDTDDWNFKSSACYDLGWLDYKWCAGSTGQY
jgi:hypothetical protein